MLSFTEHFFLGLFKILNNEKVNLIIQPRFYGIGFNEYESSNSNG